MIWISIAIFLCSLIAIIFEIYDKAVVALMGGMLMIITGVISPHEALAAIEFETIFLLLGMMLLVHMATKSGILDWIKVQMVTLTRGNPMVIFIIFSVLSAVFSAFLDNVTTVILFVPLAIALIRGIGRNPKPYILAIILFSNIGGALTLIGDPPNIIIGGATGFSFLEFVQNLWIPIGLSGIFVFAFFLLRFRKDFQSLRYSLVDMNIVALLIAKIRHQFLHTELSRSFVIKSLIVLGLTIFGFLLQEILHIPAFVTALTGAMILAMLSQHQVEMHESFRSVEWSTLFFFIGLFMIVAGVEHTGVLSYISHHVVGLTDNIVYLSLLILWSAGFVSMLLDNIPFVTVMIPIVLDLQENLVGIDSDILWWSLSLGACLGGIGTLIGASANIISINLAKRDGVNISFLEYTRFAFPLTIVMLGFASMYIFFAL